MKPKFLLITLMVAALVFSCDIYRPQRKFKLAIPEKDYFYNYMASHLEPFLDRNGYQLIIIKTSSSIEAVRMAARGEADLAFINNQSTAIADVLEEEAGRLRTVMPLTTRLLFAFSKKAMPDTATAKELFEHKKIGLESLNGEDHLNFERFLKKTEIEVEALVTFEDNPEVILFWGTFYGARASRYLKEGWHPFSFKQNLLEFQTFNDPALRPFTLPSIPGNKNSIRINTIATEALLVANQKIGENAIYGLAEVIYQNKLELLHEDIMYRSINESFDPAILLFPLHDGTTSYLRRQQPKFFVRYSNVIGLTISICAMLYGIVQGFRNKLAKRKKDQINIYFLDFLEIRSNKEFNVDQKVIKLDSLFQRAVEQMTKEKLEKSDFHILSRLIQQELSMLRF